MRTTPAKVARFITKAWQRSLKVMNDNLQLILVAGFGFLALGVVCLVIFIYFNRQSSVLALTTYAVFGAVVVCVAQYAFELRTKDTRAVLLLSFRTGGESFAFDAGRSLLKDRSIVDRAVNEFLTYDNPEPLAAEPDKVVRDYVLFSFLAYLGQRSYNWQLVERVLKSGPVEIEDTTASSRATGCTEFSEAELQRQLRATGNVFHGLRVLSTKALCLPPGSTLELTERRVAIENPFTRVSIAFQGESFEQVGVPTTHVVEATLLSRRKGLRAKHNDSEDHAAWAGRVFDGLQKWFADEGEQ